MSVGAAAWAARAWRPVLAELLATALLLLLGGMTLSPHDLTRAALGFGGVILALVQTFGSVSGAHMNPAVTLAALVVGRVDAATAAAYVLAQSAGAMLGVAALAVVSPSVVAVTAPADGALAAALAEAVMTGLLALLCCSAWTKHDDTMPIKFGLLIAALVYCGGPVSGASLNPARSLAPALWHSSWAHHWVYWVGPLGGAAVAAGLHRALLAPRSLPLPRHEDVPLRDPQEDA